MPYILRTILTGSSITTKPASSCPILTPRLETPPLHRCPAPKMLRNMHRPRRPPLQPRAAEPTRPHLLPQPRLHAPHHHAIAAQLLAMEQVEALLQAVLAHKRAVFQCPVPGTRRRGRAARHARRPGWPRCRRRRSRRRCWGESEAGVRGPVRTRVQVWRGKCVLSSCRFQDFSVSRLRQNAHWKTAGWGFLRLEPCGAGFDAVCGSIISFFLSGIEWFRSVGLWHRDG